MIEIALASDRNYVCGLLVTAVSMARAASKDADLRFNVLDGGIPDEAWCDFEKKVIDAHGRSVFRRMKVDDSRFHAFPEWNGSSRHAYARLLLPRMIPDVDHAIYCDVDFLWYADVAELWRLRDEKVFLQSTPDGTEETRSIEAPWCQARGVGYSFQRYFCSGLVLLNLRLWREHDIAGRVLAFLDRHTDVPFVDQTALNAVLGGEPLAEGCENIRMLPARWQRLSRFVTESDLRKGCVIHYAGDTPWGCGWRTQPLTDLDLLWHRIYGELMGLGEKGSLKSFFSRRAILLRRSVFNIVTTPILRWVFFIGLWMTGRGCLVPKLKVNCRRLNLDVVGKDFLGKGGAA